MAEMVAIQNYLRSFALQVRKEARDNVKGTNLEKTIKFRVEKTADGMEVKFMMAPYGTFLDKGVRGTESNYVENKDTDYTFKTKMPPTKMIEKWIKRKKLKGRVQKEWKSAGNRGGQFITTKSFAYIVARSIKRKGIKSISFFRKPLNLALKNFGLDMMGALKEDILKGWTKFKQK